MFVQSSQKRCWTFENEKQINFLRTRSNKAFIEKYGSGLNEEYKMQFFLTAEEERLLLKQYELHLKDFCRRFEPPMPKYVVGTSMHYFKRFYIYNSVMDYHPKEILATCVYVACKIEEFNVSITQFVANIKGDKSKAMDIILANELFLISQLKFFLTIHNPFRPVEGFLIDIKTRCSMINPERLRPAIDEFVDKTYYTDAFLIYSPSQIALAAVLHAASKEQENLDSYVTECLFHSAKDKLPVLIEAVRKIRSMVKSIEFTPREKFKVIEKKLERCRNQENNPDSQIYKKKQMAEDGFEFEIENSGNFGCSFEKADFSINTLCN